MTILAGADSYNHFSVVMFAKAFSLAVNYIEKLLIGSAPGP